MVQAPNAGHPSSAAVATGRSSVPNAAAQTSHQAKSKPTSSASHAVPSNNMPLSARRSEAMDMTTVERKGKPLSGNREPAIRSHIAGITEAPTYRPSEEEWQNPLEYIRKIAPEGSKYGIAKIIPPDTWNPEFAIDTERFHFKTRKQELNTCEGGTRVNLDYLDQLTKFHKSRGMSLNRLPSVDKKPLDLYALKNSVENKGGFESVCKGKKWAEIGRDLGYSGKIMSSLSTSLKNSYSKWLEPYEQYLAGAKPAVQWQMELERGGPYTPSPGPSPMHKTTSQHTPSSLCRESPTARASEALHDAIERAPPHPPHGHPQSTHPAFRSIEPARPTTGGFTAVNAGGFTPINSGAMPRPFAPVKLDPERRTMEEPRLQENRTPPPAAPNGYVPVHAIPSAPNGYAPIDLKRRRSHDTDREDSRDGDRIKINDEASNGRKRMKKESAPTVTGSHMTQPRHSVPRVLGPKERNNWKPGDYCEDCGRGDDDKNILICDTCHTGHHTYCLSPPLSSVPDFDWHCPKCLVGTGEFGFEEGGTYSLKQFQQHAARVKEEHFASKMPFDPIFNGPRSATEDDVEREFWSLVSNLTDSKVVEYGADIHSTTHGSGFPTIETHPRDTYSTDSWNLNILPLHQESLFRYIKSDISGMTVPWLYVGMIFSTFCWHNEDHYTYSANYQHFGNTKTWYGIPGADAERFEEAMKATVPELFEKQPDLLFQLVTLLSPENLKKAGVNVYAVDQRAGQFIITFPQAYHAGFNHGFNFNEAVNFAPSDWEPFGQTGVQRLQDFRRQPCFSHDELLLTAANSKEMTIRSAKWLSPALERMRDRELKARKDFEERVEDKEWIKPKPERDWRIRFQRYTDSEDLPEDEYICCYCKTFSYLSRFVCPNSNKVSCVTHIGEVECCDSTDNHAIHVRMTTNNLEKTVSRISEKAHLPDNWIEKFESTIDGIAKPPLKSLRSLLSEGERIPWPLPQLQNLKKFVERCNEWVDEATNYITRKQQNRRKNEKAWRKGSQAKIAEIEERERELRKLENVQKLLDEADHIGFDCSEITTLQERADVIAEFQKDARTALDNISSRNTQQVEDLIEIGKGFHLEIPELEHLDKIIRQMRWKDKAVVRGEQRTMEEVDDLIEEAGRIHVPEHNEHLLYLQDQKLRGQMWDTKANELMAVENVHYPQLDALARQASDLPVNRDTIARIDALLKKQREAEDRIKNLYRRTQESDIRQRPPYQELVQVIETIQELNSKPSGTIDLEREQKRHEDWMRKGKKLFGKANAPLPILHQHLKIVDERNRGCFNLADTPRLPVEPSSKDATPDSTEEEPDLFCLCRTPEAGTMIECSICREWYHSKCLKIARGKLKPEDEYVCPVCDWRVKIPRDAARPKVEEMMALHADIPDLPFQPDEEDTISSIIESALDFRYHLEQVVSQNPVLVTAEEAPIMRFYLRKIEGADILLAKETNYFRQELHRLVPQAPQAPPIIEISHSTRKPRPTKQQKLMAQHGVSTPEELPEHLRAKLNPGRQRKEPNNVSPKDSDTSSQKKNSESKVPRPAGPHAPGYVRQSNQGTKQYPWSRGAAGTHSGVVPGPATTNGGQLYFRPPLTATAFPQHHLQDNRLGPRSPRPSSPSFSAGTSGSPVTTMPPGMFSEGSNANPLSSASTGAEGGSLPAFDGPYSPMSAAAAAAAASAAQNPNLDPSLFDAEADGPTDSSGLLNDPNTEHAGSGGHHNRTEHTPSGGFFDDPAATAAAGLYSANHGDMDMDGSTADDALNMVDENETAAVENMMADLTNQNEDDDFNQIGVGNGRVSETIEKASGQEGGHEIAAEGEADQAPA